MSSGDEIEAGRITTAESTTIVLATRPSEGDVDFNGDVVLKLGPHGLFANAPVIPRRQQNIDGMLAMANGSGVGVVGLGGEEQGTGIRGVGGGGSWLGLDGHRGIGVEAIGGEAREREIGGAGLVARGGDGPEFRGRDRPEFRFFHENPARTPGGAGIVAVAGGRAVSPDPDIYGNVGIVGQGGDARHDTRKDDRTGQTAVFGPQTPGAGIMGFGGVTWTNAGNSMSLPTRMEGDCGPGVVGVTGGETKPPEHSAVHDVGVVGISERRYGVLGQSAKSAGLFGTSSEGTGITASSDKDRAAVFISHFMPQLRLLPIIDTTGGDDEGRLQGKGQPGDFLVVEHPVDGRTASTASLWFCTSVGNWTKLA